MRTFVFLHVLTMFGAVALSGGIDVLLLRIARTRDVRAIRTAFGVHERFAPLIPAFFGVGLLFGLIAIFVERYGRLPDGRQVKHYYPAESVGLATGILITAIQHVGLVSLTHTPSPMKFLNEILKRPSNESCFLLLVVGYPAEDAVVPDIKRKQFEEVCTFV